MSVIRRTSDEEAPLLGQPGKNSDFAATARSLKEHFAANITKKRADLVLLFCYIITGLLDSSALYIWGAFVSMQTGNTIYFGLGVVAPHEGIRWIKSGVSIVFYCLGSFLFARFHRYFSPTKRWVMVASFTFQLLLIIVAAAIVTLGDSTFNDPKILHWQTLVPLSIVAFQSSGQAVTSRVLEYNGLTSVVLTGTYTDLFSDANLFAKSNSGRNSKIAASLLLLLGAALGGFFSHSSIGLKGALWTAAVLKAFVIVAWVFWKSETKGDSDDETA